MSLAALLVAVTLLDFDDPADAALWRPVDDVVMGGVSRSAFEQAGDGVARFHGNVSLSYEPAEPVRNVGWMQLSFWFATSQNRLSPGDMADPRIAQWAKGDPQAEAFLFWSRMPIAAPGPKGILLTDQRFMDVPTRSTFTIELKPKP